MKKLLALLLMIWLLLPIAGAEEAYTMQDGSLILMDGAGRKCQPIAMKPDFPEALLADADISGAIQLNLPETLLPYVSDELTGGEMLVEMYCTTELIAMHTVDAADGDVLRVAYRTNLGNYVIRKVIGTPFSFDRYHGGAASILLCVDEITYCMTCENGYLTLREVWNGAGGIGIKRHAIYDLQACVESAGGNAGFRYGNHPPCRLQNSRRPMKKPCSTLTARIGRLSTTQIRRIDCTCAARRARKGAISASSTTERPSMWTKSAATGRMSPSGATSPAG